MQEKLAVSGKGESYSQTKKSCRISDMRSSYRTMKYKSLIWGQHIISTTAFSEEVWFVFWVIYIFPATGRVTVSVSDFSSAVVAVILPRWAVTTAFAMESPRP